MMKAMHHTAISTFDMDRLIKFYCDLLGFEVEQEFEWPAGIKEADNILALKDTTAKAVMLKLGDFRLELFQFSSPEPKPSDPNRPVVDHGLTHLAFTVEDIHAEYDRLVKAGMRFHCPPQNIGAIVTYGRDPDGNVVELMQIT
ncbi:MAG: VOC family protein [Deltaproteobacteria bacterium]|nr:VOC family protein [Deltaproteobacteria bacterium]MBW1985561.1 VOC family protein [Deltaproteobacteria bacterium]